MERPVQPDLPGVEAPERRPKRSRAPYGLATPALLWLLLLFVIPMLAMASLSLQTGNSLEGFRQTFRFANFADALSQNGSS